MWADGTSYTVFALTPLAHVWAYRASYTVFANTSLAHMLTYRAPSADFAFVLLSQVLAKGASSTILAETFHSIMSAKTNWSADSARIFLLVVYTFQTNPLLFEDHIDDNALVCVIHSVIIVSNLIKHDI